MTDTLASVLGAVRDRVGYLRAAGPSGDGFSAGDGWSPASALGADDLALAVDAGVAAGGGTDRQVVASLFAQSYAFKVGAVSLAAYAVGLPWPSPAATDVAVQLRGGRATGVRFASSRLGDPEDATGLAAALVDDHLRAFSGRLRDGTTIGERLVRGNVAASSAAAFRAVEGAARDRCDTAERAAVRERAAAFFAAASWLDGAGRFERVEVDGVDGWFWTRTSCCLYYKVSSGATCDDCSLIATADLQTQRRDELERGRP